MLRATRTQQKPSELFIMSEAAKKLQHWVQVQGIGVNFNQ